MYPKTFVFVQREEWGCFGLEIVMEIGRNCFQHLFLFPSSLHTGAPLGSGKLVCVLQAILRRAHGLLICIHWIANLFHQHHCCSQELWPPRPYLELAFARSRTIAGGSLPFIASHRHLHLISRPGARISRLLTATHALLLPC